MLGIDSLWIDGLQEPMLHGGKFFIFATEIKRMEIGDKVRPSDYALENNVVARRFHSRCGTIVRFGYSFRVPVVYVRWDGNHTASSYHRAFLEVVE